MSTPSWPLASAFVPVSVGADIVPLDHVGLGARGFQNDAVVRVAGDDVAGAGRRPAHGVGGRPAERCRRPLAVGHGRGAGQVGADIVTFDDVVPDVPASEMSTTPSIALPEMTSRAPAVVPPTVLEVAPPTISTPSLAVGNGLRSPVLVGADVVALDDVARGARAGQHDAVERVAGDDVAGACRGPAHRVGGRPGRRCPRR